MNFSKTKDFLRFTVSRFFVRFYVQLKFDSLEAVKTNVSCWYIILTARSIQSSSNYSSISYGLVTGFPPLPMVSLDNSS